MDAAAMWMEDQNDVDVGERFGRHIERIHALMNRPVEPALSPERMPSASVRRRQSAFAQMETPARRASLPAPAALLPQVAEDLQLESVPFLERSVKYRLRRASLDAEEAAAAAGIAVPEPLVRPREPEPEESESEAPMSCSAPSASSYWPARPASPPSSARFRRATLAVHTGPSAAAGSTTVRLREAERRRRDPAFFAETLAHIERTLESSAARGGVTVPGGSRRLEHGKEVQRELAPGETHHYFLSVPPRAPVALRLWASGGPAEAHASFDTPRPGPEECCAQLATLSGRSAELALAASQVAGDTLYVAVSGAGPCGSSYALLVRAAAHPRLALGRAVQGSVAAGAPPAYFALPAPTAAGSPVAAQAALTRSLGVLLQTPERREGAGPVAFVGSAPYPDAGRCDYAVTTDGKVYLPLPDRALYVAVHAAPDGPAAPVPFTLSVALERSSAAAAGAAKYIAKSMWPQAYAALAARRDPSPRRPSEPASPPASPPRSASPEPRPQPFLPAAVSPRSPAATARRSPRVPHSRSANASPSSRSPFASPPRRAASPPPSPPRLGASPPRAAARPPPFAGTGRSRSLSPLPSCAPTPGPRSPPGTGRSAGGSRGSSPGRPAARLSSLQGRPSLSLALPAAGRAAVGQERGPGGAAKESPPLELPQALVTAPSNVDREAREAAAAAAAAASAFAESAALAPRRPRSLESF